MQGGHRAVIFDRVQGVKNESTGEGTHFLVPWLQRAVLFDVRTKPRNISTTTGSKGKITRAFFYKKQKVPLTKRE